MHNSIIIAVDGGATKTHLAVASSTGEILSLFESGGTYFLLEDSAENMVQLLRPISGKVVSSAVFTVSGWDSLVDQRRQRALIEAALKANNITVEKALYQNDVYATLKSGIGSATSAVAISCGTGIIGVALDNGKYYRTPGYEYLSGEWGSGIHLAEYAIHLACASLLGREEPYPLLVEKAFYYFEATDLDSLVKNLTTKFTSNRDRGFFVKQVYEAYLMGCPGSTRVLYRAGEEMARTIWGLLKKMESKEVPLIFGGGVIRNFGLPPKMKERLYQLTDAYYDCYIVYNEQVYGALFWALEEAGASTAMVNKELDCRLVS